MPLQSDYVINLVAGDRPGIVAATTAALADLGLNILSSQQFQDRESERFFMRLGVETRGISTDSVAIYQKIDDAMTGLGTKADTTVWDTNTPPRVLIMVSKFDHCLLDLLYRQQTGTLWMEVAGIVSNHRDAEKIAAQCQLPFYHLPVTPNTKPTQEGELLKLIETTSSELVILARYMQILSNDCCTALAGRAINIHHSFLPSFKGARPYHQAHSKGVKLIGATAHYVTPDLDEGPIIEQNVSRVHHAMTPADLKEMGKDVERLTLAEAVKLHLERRVMLNGSKTVVLRAGG